MTVVAGIDGYRKGWVAVVLVDGRFERAEASARLASLIGRLVAAEAIGIDMPIGLPVRGPRPADALARAFVGPRRSSVFPTLPRAVWEAPDLAEARKLSIGVTGSSVSAQTYALRPRVLEVDQVARADRRIREVHPEVSFRALAGHPLASPKSSWSGILLRRRLLTGVGVLLPDDIGPAGVAGVDDVLDAAVAAWSALRIAAGLAHSLPEHPVLGPDGHVAAIWF